ncbi:MAG: hypothetical protein KF722_18305 [Nitrospira sp.]|nr:hypothetical protein [Nitrospira sp.]
MNGTLFPEGGPNRVKSLENNQYKMSFTIPTDEDGRMGRQCPIKTCSPGYFKVKPGTGVTGGQVAAYCPYCRHSTEPSDFATKEQIRYAKGLLLREVQKGVNEMIRDTMGLGASGKRKIGGGFLSVELSYKPGTLPHVRQPVEDEVRREVVCPLCTLDQTVFGLAMWCADCGKDIFMVHVSAELAVIRRMVDDIGRREASLGRRVAAKDHENCLEDAVSIFEASAKAIVRRALIERGDTPEQIDAHFKKIGNSFQSIERTRSQLKELFGFDLDADSRWESLSSSFAKRHPVTHNLGVIDRKYLERIQEAEREGREVRISTAEIQNLLIHVEQAVSHIHSKLGATTQHSLLGSGEYGLDDSK